MADFGHMNGDICFQVLGVIQKWVKAENIIFNHITDQRKSVNINGCGQRHLACFDGFRKTECMLLKQGDHTNNMLNIGAIFNWDRYTVQTVRIFPCVFFQ